MILGSIEIKGTKVGIDSELRSSWVHLKVILIALDRAKQTSFDAMCELDLRPVIDIREFGNSSIIRILES
jgi:hypothetical protein